MATKNSIHFIVIWLAVAAALSAALGHSGVIFAHGGGFPQLTNVPAGPYLVTVWTQPQPMRVGEAHFSVAVSEPLVDDADIGVLVLDATVELELVSNATSEPIKLAATHGNALNKLYYEADANLTETGPWQVTVTVSGPAGSGSTGFSADVQPAVANTLWILWASMGVVAVTVLWGARAYHNGGNLRRIVPVVATVAILVPLGAGLLAQALKPPSQAAVSTFNWPFFGPGEPDLVVNVSASQWQWQFEYPANGITTTELVLPTGKNVQLNLTSTDVIHSFGIPEFGLSQDVMPGTTTTVQLTPTKTGNYAVICEAFCGLDYQDMLAEITVIDPDNFESWLAQQSNK